ncbi:HAD family hydrolase [Halococcus saccharolyticus]|uniref:HAD-superfamily hydrolase, subfamily IA, variant 3 n=1 Tax=Halococcus saccharolyticus DSM 5350 TaxID=1227455 RepID=M0MFG9_9EURY|nr:HAD family hydrolase [Halococcus saccharolyticus]EMA43434.1 HAD-superfamily hydrolase, subfamily IA, variant 3 [Halococcus saccharolyticus DSM 5350]
MTIRAVAFDLDYTLAVPERDRQTLLDEASAAVDGPCLSREAYLDAHRRHLTNRTREPIFDDLLADCDTDASAAALADTYRETIANALVPVAGAEELVRSLRQEYRVGLLTDGPVRAQQAKIDALGWNDLFDAVVITGALEAGKPDDRAFRAELDALGTTADETIYVGDSAELDIAGARAAGLRAIHVLDDGTPSPAADATIERDALAEQLPGVVARFN